MFHQYFHGLHNKTHMTETSSRTRVPLQPLNGPLDHHHYADSKSGVINHIAFYLFSKLNTSLHLCTDKIQPYSFKI